MNKISIQDELKRIVEGESILVFDTSALLEVYSFSPDTYSFIVECLSGMKDYTYLPASVYEEYYFQNQKHFFAARDRLKEYMNKLAEVTEECRSKYVSFVDVLANKNYPEIANLRKQVDVAFKELSSVLEQYNKSNPYLEELQSTEFETDSLRSIVDDINSKHQRPFLTRKEMFEVSERAEKTIYYPGKKDKKKKGLRKYNDSFIWEEIKKLSKELDKDILLLTCEKKSDWFEDSGVIRKPLSESFTNYTSHKINVINSLLDFFHCCGEKLSIHHETPRKLALQRQFEELLDEELQKRAVEYLERGVIDEILNEKCGCQFDSFEDSELDSIEMEEAYCDNFNAEKGRLSCYSVYSVCISSIGLTYSGHDSEDDEYYYMPSTCEVKFNLTVRVDLYEDKDEEYCFSVDGFEMDSSEYMDIVVK